VDLEATPAVVVGMHTVTVDEEVLPEAVTGDETKNKVGVEGFEIIGLQKELAKIIGFFYRCKNLSANTKGKTSCLFSQGVPVECQKK
jgi:hypothetical protein